MEKITKLTKAQVDRMPEWVEKWVRIGLSCEPADWERAEAGARGCYRAAGLREPSVILRLSSPYGALVGGILAVLALKKSLRSQVWSEVESKVQSQVWSQVQSKVRLQVQSQVESKIQLQVWREVGSKVGSQVQSQVWSKVESEVRSQVGLTSNYRGGQLWAGWYSYISFLRDVCGWEEPSLTDYAHDEAVALSASWWWLHDAVCAISDRPEFLHRDERGRMHSTDGPALRYRDGWSIYSVHGVMVPEAVVKREYDEKAITSEANAEVRRVMLDLYGADRYIREIGAKPVHSDDFGALYRSEMGGDEPLVMVRVVNSTPNPDGTRKDYWIRVPPAVKTAREAVAWTFGMKKGEYCPAQET